MKPFLPVLVLAVGAVPTFAQSENEETSNAPSKVEYTKEVFAIRDPFKQPKLAPPLAEAKSDLERYSVSRIKMLGVITGPDKLRAMLLTPNGKTFFVKLDDKIGKKRGRVKQITTDEVVVEEFEKNLLGKEVIRVSKIKLPEEE